MIFKRLAVLTWNIRYHNWLAKLYKKSVLQIWAENPYLNGRVFV